MVLNKLMNNIITLLKNIIKNNYFDKITRQTISQTDQKKQPCLAVKPCQLIRNKISSVLEKILKSIMSMLTTKSIWQQTTLLWVQSGKQTGIQMLKQQ